MSETEYLSEILTALRFLGSGTVLGLGVLWGAISWRLTILAKNQSNVW